MARRDASCRAVQPDLPEIRLLSPPPQPSRTCLSVNSWITSPSGLADWLSLGSPRTSVAIDTEFVRERTFHPRLALVQMAWDDSQIALVDVLALAEPAGLVALLDDRAVTKVMHSASEDLQALHHTYGILPRPLFDTQVA